MPAKPNHMSMLLPLDELEAYGKQKHGTRSCWVGELEYHWTGGMATPKGRHESWPMRVGRGKEGLV